MNLFELFVKIGVDDQASNKLGNITSKLGNGLKTAAKIGTAAVGVATTAITALTKAAVDNYAEYEQLVGGVDTLFKDASQKVQQYAAEAYRTSGMSANDYMANATAFSASLISSLGGDTEKAAEYANRAMVSMSDNANKMGTSLDSIVQTYQSLSRGNMAMLDNLKLGYGGTKAELERLIKDAASYTDIQKEMGITVDESSMSFDNIVNAIAVVQGKLGIAGATAQEAGTTIEGSVNSMKAAWDNLITGVANKNADLGGLINNFVTTIVGDGTEKNLGVIGNVLPAVETALNGAVTLIEKLFPKIIDELPGLISTLLPSIVTGALNIIQAFVSTISQNGDLLVQSGMQAIEILASGLLSMLPEVIKVGLELITSLALGIAESLPELIPTTIDVILKIVEILTDQKQLNQLLDAALVLVEELAEGLEIAIPALVGAALTLVEKLVSFILKPENLEKIINAAVKIVLSLASGLVKAIPDLVSSALKLVKSLFDAIFKTDWASIGRNIVNGIWGGLKALWGKLSSWFSQKWEGLISGVKKILGIASPSKVFRKIGRNIASSVGIGWEDEFGDVQDEINGSLEFGGGSASLSSVGGGVGGRPINITQNIYAQKKSAAQLMQEARWQAQLGVLSVV